MSQYYRKQNKRTIIYHKKRTAFFSRSPKHPF
jgi:hypothetical protein